MQITKSDQQNSYSHCQAILQLYNYGRYELSHRSITWLQGIESHRIKSFFSTVNRPSLTEATAAAVAAAIYRRDEASGAILATVLASVDATLLVDADRYDGVLR